MTTPLDSDQYTAEDIAELYGLRWDVETDIAGWKTTMGFCDLRCLTPKNLDREIAVGVLAYNLVRSLMNDAAAVMEVHPREISFSRSRDAWISFSDELNTSTDLMWIILTATSRLVRDRPGREEPRELKRRKQSKYPKPKNPRPSRAKRIAAETVKPPDKPSVHAIRAYFRFSRPNYATKSQLLTQIIRTPPPYLQKSNNFRPTHDQSGWTNEL